MKSAKWLRAFVLVFSFGLLGAAPYADTHIFKNTKPDTEEREFYSPTDEDTGLELQTSRSQLDADSFYDWTQGSVDQAQGFYSHGTLTNASSFALEGRGFVKILRPRKRWYVTYDLKRVVEYAAARLHHDYPGGERIQIGDVCSEHGGFLTHHASHQNGLDADLVYPRVNHHEQDPGISTGFEELFVKDGKISPNFDEERAWEFVKNLHSTGRVVRIFMDPVIKATLCTYAKKIGEYESHADVLRRIRPLVNHQDHMHVRISCPKKSPHCVAQADPPAGTGCEAVLQSSLLDSESSPDTD